MQFKDRKHAGQVLAQRLEHYRNQPDVVILALPRGGVPVAFEVAQALHAPLDVFIVRKLGFPGHEDFAMGAIATGGVRVMNPDAMDCRFPRRRSRRSPRASGKNWSGASGFIAAIGPRQ